MSPVLAIAKRELRSYFATPLATVFIVIFLLLSGVVTFYVGGFFEAGQADLQSFFRFHPWLYLLLVPAVSMPLWAEERKTGTLELMLTQPVAVWQAVLGKFLAAWGFIPLAPAPHLPVWVTGNWPGEAGHRGGLGAVPSRLGRAGAFLAVGSCLSATTRSQVVAFILTVMACLLLLLAGFPLALDPLRGVFSQPVIDAVSGLSFLTHFQAITRGVLDLRDVSYFLLAITAWLTATVLVIHIRKAD